MPSPNRAALVAVPVAVLLGLAAWLALSPSPPPAADRAALPKVAAGPAAALPGAPSDSAVDAPEAPSLGVMAGQSVSGDELLVRTTEDGLKALQLAITRGGGVAALAQVERATVTQQVAGPGLSLTGTARYDGDRGLVLDDAASGDQTGLHAEGCWQKHHGIVFPCSARADVLVRGLSSAHAASVLLPLTRPPYRLVAADTGEVDGQRVHVLRFEVAVPRTDVLLMLDPRDERPVRIEVSRLDACCTTRVDFAEWQMFGAARLPALRRLALLDQQKRWQSMTIRIRDLQPGTALPPPPPWTLHQPMRIDSRAAMLPVEVKAGTHAGVLPALQRLEAEFGAFEHAPQLALLEALGRPDNAETLDIGVALWLVLPEALVTAPKLQALRVAVPAELRVAIAVERVAATGAIAAMDRLVAAARKAGHAPGNGRPTVQYHGATDPKTSEVTMELRLPLAAP